VGHRRSAPHRSLKVTTSSQDVAGATLTIENAAALPVQSQSKAQPVVAGVIEICVGVARVRIEGTPDAATLRIVLRTLRAAAEAEA